MIKEGRGRGDYGIQIILCVCVADRTSRVQSLGFMIALFEAFQSFLFFRTQLWIAAAAAFSPFFPSILRIHIQHIFQFSIEWVSLSLFLSARFESCLGFKHFPPFSVSNYYTTAVCVYPGIGGGL